MWSLRREQDGKLVHNFFVGQTYKVARPKDQYLRGYHAFIDVYFPRENVLFTANPPVLKLESVRDNFLNRASLQCNEIFILKNGDQVAFGRWDNAFRVSYVPLIVTSLGLKPKVVKEVMELVYSMGGQYSHLNRWTSCCTHLVMEEITCMSDMVTDFFRDKRPIVTPQYIRELKKCIAQKLPLPDAKRFYPSFSENFLQSFYGCDLLPYADNIWYQFMKLLSSRIEGSELLLLAKTKRNEFEILTLPVLKKEHAELIEQCIHILQEANVRFKFSVGVNKKSVELSKSDHAGSGPDCQQSACTITDESDKVSTMEPTKEPTKEPVALEFNSQHQCSIQEIHKDHLSNREVTAEHMDTNEVSIQQTQSTTSNLHRDTVIMQLPEATPDIHLTIPLNLTDDILEELEILCFDESQILDDHPLPSSEKDTDSQIPEKANGPVLLKNKHPSVEALPSSENVDTSVEAHLLNKNVDPSVEALPLNRNVDPSIEALPLNENVDASIEALPLNGNVDASIEALSLNRNVDPSVEALPLNGNIDASVEALSLNGNVDASVEDLSLNRNVNPSVGALPLNGNVDASVEVLPLNGNVDASVEAFPLNGNVADMQLL